MISFCIVMSVVLLRTNGHDLFDIDEIILKNLKQNPSTIKKIHYVSCFKLIHVISFRNIKHFCSIIISNILNFFPC